MVARPPYPIIASPFILNHHGEPVKPRTITLNHVQGPTITLSHVEPRTTRQRPRPEPRRRTFRAPPPVIPNRREESKIHSPQPVHPGLDAANSQHPQSKTPSPFFHPQPRRGTPTRRSRDAHPSVEGRPPVEGGTFRTPHLSFRTVGRNLGPVDANAEAIDHGQEGGG